MPDGADELCNLEARIKKSTAELVELERSLVAGDIDARVLRDFRDAVDYVRKAAWAVQEWQERKSKSHDTSTVLPLLMFERIRRATQVCRIIATEWNDDAATASIAELSEAIDALRWRFRGH